MVRQKNMYMLVDMVMHISPMDQVAEKESFPFIKYYKLLRMPIRAFRILNKNMPAPMQGRSFLRTAHIGFIGNGMTPTNHLGIQWFLENCWEVCFVTSVQNGVLRCQFESFGSERCPSGCSAATTRRAHATHRSASRGAHGQGRADAVRQD